MELPTDILLKIGAINNDINFLKLNRATSTINSRNKFFSMLDPKSKLIVVFFKRACKQEKLDLIESLIMNIEPNIIKNEMNQSCRQNKVKNVKILLKYIDPNYIYNGRSPLGMACAKGSIESVDILCNNPHVDLMYDDNQGLIGAVGYGKKDVVIKLLQHPRFVHPNTNFISKGLFDWNPLMKAIMGRNIEIAKILLDDPRINVKVNKCSAFECAVIHQQFEILAMMLKKLDNQIDKELIDKYSRYLEKN